MSDTFINLTLGEEIFFRNFIKTHPAFCERKFELREIDKPLLLTLVNDATEFVKAISQEISDVRNELPF